MEAVELSSLLAQVEFQMSGRREGMWCDSRDAVEARRRLAWLSRVGSCHHKEQDVQKRLDWLRQWGYMSQNTRQGLLLLLLPEYVPYAHKQAGLMVVYVQ